MVRQDSDEYSQWEHKAEAVRAHTEGRLLEAEQAYRILLERNDDADVAVGMVLLRSRGRPRGSSHYHRLVRNGCRNMLINAYNCWKETGENAASLHWLQHALEDNPMTLNTEAGEETRLKLGIKQRQLVDLRRLSGGPTYRAGWGSGRCIGAQGTLSSASCYNQLTPTNQAPKQTCSQFTNKQENLR